ncbi:Planctomycete cytochrome C [Luteitalea pratensis]|uniref:Planctomycete cytochrome C n=1 Tax=Luteitalea pratensis TaxID=1855912 RepID=A0A143PHV9_LUTPR|nr:PSD1 and planctomycete cytochrome C domain-containing protein [Luteitalea pratensis]AMY08006.1 Planctomycete cytochrome C [Luteitalea pratensis]
MRTSRPYRRFAVSLFVFAAAFGPWRPSWLPGDVVATAQPAAKVDFATQIEPILREQCYECHGEKKGRGKLRLHIRDLALKGGATGPLLVAGNSAKSYLVQRLLGEGGEDQMPLDKDPLSAEQTALIRAWIDQGAEWPATPGATPGAAPTQTVEEHWAYLKPKKAAPPAVSNEAWTRTPVDRFVLARLDTEKLMPSHEASRETLLRRVSLDLTGLPPTLAELDAFLADTRPDAYERVVDRLLASPHFGERWARLWLDLARYADSNGFEADRLRSMWPYRDWVIKALNADMPFDRFTVEQIAGDMLPGATRDQRIATGFHRNAMTNEEGGVDPDEALFEVQVDRVNTTATVWLGSTVACAQCHNHKYDPFSQKDYYRLMAFFANPAFQAEKYGAGTKYVESQVDLATPEQEAIRTALRTELKAAEDAIAKDTPERIAAQARWEADVRAAARAWTPLVPRTAAATNGAQLTVRDDASIVASGPNPQVTAYTVEASSDTTAVTGLRLEALLDPSLPKEGPGRDAYGHFRVTRVHVFAAPASDPTKRTRVDFKTVKGDGNVSRGDLLALTTDAPIAYSRLGKAWVVDAVREGWRVPFQLVLVPKAPIGFPGGTVFTVTIGHEDGTLGQGLGRFRLSTTTAAAPLEVVAVSARTRAAIVIPLAKRTATQAKELATQFREQSPTFEAERRDVTRLKKAIEDLKLPTTLVMEDKPSYERPSTPLRERGAFTSPGQRVYANTPSALPAMSDDLPPNRLGLARWLVSRDNPLTARVMVNRLWEALYGRGIVETSEDFGTMGSPPSHPELLDWLAVEFVEKGWSVKTTLKMLVLSATYQQDSAVSADLEARDPYNRLLARGPRFRLEAEMVRDVALAASGKLSEGVGGPSVFPSQPPNIWDNPYDNSRWIESTGEDRYRRSLYTFHRRTAPYPMFMTFDATSRELCTVRRVRTNTPLQALATLNDQGFFELARALAARIRTEAPRETVDARISFGFRLVTSRLPSAAELERLRAFQTQTRQRYAAAPGEAAEALGLTKDTKVTADELDLAAWTMVANVLLNLDETVTKG